MNGRCVDVLVIGGGILGLSVAWATSADSTHSVALLERALIGHDLGSSAGDARLRVLAGYPDESYIGRGLTAGQDWAAVECAAGVQLFTATGCLSWGSGQDEMLAALRRYDAPHEVWQQRDVDRAYPGVRLPPATPVIHQPDAGILHADRALTAFARLAHSRGASLQEGVRVLAFRVTARCVEVETTEGWWSAGQVVVCAGPWIRPLLADVGISLPVVMTSQTVCYFPLTRPAPLPGMIQYGNDDPYALFSPDRGLKAALHAPGPRADPDAERAPDPAAARATAEWVRRHFPGVATDEAVIGTCIYTSTPDERFLIERHGPIIAVSACSGHGFQYAPDTARRVATMLSAA